MAATRKQQRDTPITRSHVLLSRRGLRAILDCFGAWSMLLLRRHCNLLTPSGSGVEEACSRTEWHPDRG